MREIKFRAWNSESEIMIYSDKPEGDYWGDIVRCINNHTGVIEWEKHDACFNVSDYYQSSNDYPTMAFMEGQPFEVIGNIYDNPDLC